jgi:hypothetical protein
MVDVQKGRYSQGVYVRRPQVMSYREWYHRDSTDHVASRNQVCAEAARVALREKVC